MKTTARHNASLSLDVAMDGVEAARAWARETIRSHLAEPEQRHFSTTLWLSRTDAEVVRHKTFLKTLRSAEPGFRKTRVTFSVAPTMMVYGYEGAEKCKVVLRATFHPPAVDAPRCRRCGEPATRTIKTSLEPDEHGVVRYAAVIKPVCASRACEAAVRDLLPPLPPRSPRARCSCGADADAWWRVGADVKAFCGETCAERFATVRKVPAAKLEDHQ